jgi:hypothetical protein
LVIGVWSPQGKAPGFLLYSASVLAFNGIKADADLKAAAARTIHEKAGPSQIV